MSKIIIAVPRGRIIGEIKEFSKNKFAPEKMFNDKSESSFSSKEKMLILSKSNF